MKGWKTFAFNVAAGVVGVLLAAFADAPLDPQDVGIATTVLGSINVVLRYVTTTPIFEDR